MLRVLSALAGAVCLMSIEYRSLLGNVYTYDSPDSSYTIQLLFSLI